MPPDPDDPLLLFGTEKDESGGASVTDGRTAAPAALARDLPAGGTPHQAARSPGPTVDRSLLDRRSATSHLGGAAPRGQLSDAGAVQKTSGLFPRREPMPRAGQRTAAPSGSTVQTTASPVCTLDLLTSGEAQVYWDEAVAIIQELCDLLLDQPSDGPILVPDLHQVEITAAGQLRILARTVSHETPVVRVGRLLHELVPDETPPKLRLVVLQTLVSPPSFASIRDLSDALTFFERSDRAALLEQARDRWRVTTASGVVAGERERVNAERSFRARRRGQVLWVATAAVAIVGIAALGALWMVLSGASAAGIVPVTNQQPVPFDTGLGSVTLPRPAGNPDQSEVSPGSGSNAAMTPPAAEPQASERPPAQTPVGTANYAAPRRAPRAPRAPEPAPAPLAAATEPSESADAPTAAPPPIPVAPTEDSGASPVPVETSPDPGMTVAIAPPPAPSPTPTPPVPVEAQPPAPPETVPPRDIAGEASATDLRIYGPEDSGVTPPSVVRPTLPVQFDDAEEGRVATVEVVVGIEGDVLSIRMLSPLHRLPDISVLSVVKSWKFLPASKDGRPVPYRAAFRIRLPHTVP